MTGGRAAPDAHIAHPADRGEDWHAVAAAINGRMASMRIGQQELADLAGISVSTLRLVQHGANRRVRNKTLSALAGALGWPEDHLVRVLTGGHQDVASAGAARSDHVGLQILDGVREIQQELGRIARRLEEMECGRRPSGG